MARKGGKVADMLDVGKIDFSKTELGRIEAPRDASEDVKKALDSYKKIRAGSLRGAATTKRMVEIAKEKLDEWKE